MEPVSLAMAGELVPAAPAVSGAANDDDQLVRIWLCGRSAHTQRAYQGDIDRFRIMVPRPLREVTLADLQGWAATLEAGMAPSSRSRAIACVKSLFAFARRIGYTTFDVAAPLRIGALRDDLAQRILPVAQVKKMIRLETDARNHLLLQLMYATGGRVSEISQLVWSDCQPRDRGRGQVTLFGKGRKTRAVVLPPAVWSKLVDLRKDAAEDAAVFASRNRGGRVSVSQIWRVVRAAARRAGITAAVSPHWFRHAHASHSIDEGADLTLVQQTLGHSSINTTARYIHVRPGKSSGEFLTF